VAKITYIYFDILKYFVFKLSETFYSIDAV